MKGKGQDVSCRVTAMSLVLTPPTTRLYRIAVVITVVTRTYYEINRTRASVVALVRRAWTGRLRRCGGQCARCGARRGTRTVPYAAGSPRRPRLSRSTRVGSVRSGIEQQQADSPPRAGSSREYVVRCRHRDAGRRAINITQIQTPVTADIMQSPSCPKRAHTYVVPDARR